MEDLTGLAGDRELLRLLMGFAGLDLGNASCLLTIIGRYLEGDVTKEEMDMWARER